MRRGAVGTTFDDKWKCSWFPECNAPCQPPCRNPEHIRKKCAAYNQHELKDCVHGKWGFYYSPDGSIQTWRGIHKDNPSGCAIVYLLIYNQDKQQFLFELNKNGKYNFPSYRRLTSYPEDLYEVAIKYLATLFSNDNQNHLRSCIPHRFIFTDASVIYPVRLNNEDASKILFKTGRKWFDRQEVERAMKAVTLKWERKGDNQSYGYDIKKNEAHLGQRSVFPLAALILRWLAADQSVEAATIKTTSSFSLHLASLPASRSIPGSISDSDSVLDSDSILDSDSSSNFGSISNCTSGFASACPSVSASSIFDEPDKYVSFDEFFKW